MVHLTDGASGNRDGSRRRLSIAVLGGLRFALDGRVITGFESDKARALLVYLAHHAGHPIRRDALAALLWGDRSSALAGQNLRKTLSRLRTTLGEPDDGDGLLKITPQTVEFVAGPALDMDACAFTALAEQARTHRHRHASACRACLSLLERAAGLYGGDFLRGFSPGDCPEFDDWAGFERERLHAEAVGAMTRLADMLGRVGRHADALACARRALALEPWSEAAHRAAMRAHAAEGRRAAALAQYAACVEVLSREFGIGPDPDTRALHDRLRASTDGLPRADAPRVPGPVNAFVGRADELNAIEGHLQDPDTRLLTLVGAGGSGKTRLALESARGATAAFDDGVTFLSLAPLQSPDEIPPALARALGLALSAAAGPRAQVAGFLRDKDALLVLDNFEHLMAGADLVGELLRACPRLFVLATSRERLNVYGERVLPVAPLPAAHALELFEQRARAHHPAFAITRDNADAVRAICERLDGLPLALELAAARSPQFEPHEMLARLEPRLDFLVDGPRDLEARQRTLWAALEWSFRLLDPAEQLLFRRLSVFAGGFSAEAVEAVCNPDGALGSLSEATLRALARRSLVSPEPWNDDGQPRFGMLETVREFAQAQLETSPDGPRIRERHFAHCLAVAEESETRLPTAERPRWFARLEAERHNMAAALAWAFESGEPSRALRLSTALGTWWEVRTDTREGRRTVERALRGAEAAPPALQAKAWFWLGRIGLRQGALREARGDLARGLELYRAVGDERGAAAVLNDLGSVAHWMGDYDTAERVLGESLALRESLGDRWGIAQATNNLGMTRHRRGDHAAAGACFQRCLEAWQAIGAEMPLAWPLGGLGQVALAEGDVYRALVLIKRSVAIWRAHRFDWALALRLNDLGLAELLFGDAGAAAAAHEEARSLCQKLGDARGLAFAAEGLARVAAARGDEASARALCAESDAGLSATGAVLGAFERNVRARLFARSWRS